MCVEFTEKGVQISNDGGIVGYGYHIDATEKYDSISYDWPNLKGFINTVLYSNYLTAFETRFVDGKLTDVKAWILYGAERNLLIITGKNDKLEIQESVFDTEGIEVQNISEAEKVQINEIVKILYSK